MIRCVPNTGKKLREIILPAKRTTSTTSCSFANVYLYQLIVTSARKVLHFGIGSKFDQKGFKHTLPFPYNPTVGQF